METGHSAQALTYADYEQFPDDSLRHEIIHGEHYVTASPVTKHQRILRNLADALLTCLKAAPAGELLWAPFDVVLSNIDVVVPDIIYLSNERSARYLTDRNLQGPPDLVVEITSPATKRRDRILKRQLYERVGVKEYWLIDPDRETVTIYRRGATAFAGAIVVSTHGSLATPLMPSLNVPVREIFEGTSLNQAPA